MLVLASGAGTKTVGGCPIKFELVTIESLGLTPEVASGIPSLDSNRPEPAPILAGFVFCDNAVK
jgi:hypothetical protein